MSKAASRAERLLGLLDSVYEAALDEDRWSMLAPQIASTFGSTSTTIQVQRIGASSKILSLTDNVRQRIDDYRAHYWQRDIWVERAVELIGLSRIATSGDLLTDTEFQETEFYRDWCRYLDVFYVVGAVFPSGEGQLGVLGIHRPRTAGAYQDEDKYWVSRFMPHLQRALRLRDQLGQATTQAGLSTHTLDRCGTAAILVTQDGQIIYANGIAEVLLTQGHAICQRNRRLAATSAADNARLSNLVRQTAGTTGERGGNGALLITGTDRRSLSVLVAPFPMMWPGVPAAGALLLLRGEQPLSAIAALQALFHLTPTEARIAQALANGKSLDEISSDHRVTLPTVRKQLKGVLAKTGTNRQAQCVALIWRSIASLSRE